MSILWASVFSVSTKRRLQVFSAFLFFVMIYFGEVVCLVLFFSILINFGNFGKLFCLCYLTYFYFDRQSAENGSRGQGNKTIRNFFLWRFFTGYFQMKVVKTVDLLPAKNYIFAFFPHGVMSVSAFGNFASSTTNFSELFPKIRSKFCTLNFHFFVPFYRDLFLSWGMISVGCASIKNALLQSTDEDAKSNADGFRSNAVVIAVGGSQEVLNARPGDYRLVLKNRKGFIKIAIQTGASIVPVFSFGEIDIYSQPSNDLGTNLRKFQDFSKKYIGIVPPIVNGRGFLQYSFGVIPRRRSITTVVGAPIDVEFNECPTDEEIDRIHENFIVKLKELFDSHKKKYIDNFRDVLLTIE